MSILINGQEAGHVEPLDRGLHYGDGLFETMAIAAGRVRFLDWHFERLAEGARRLGIALPESALLRAEIAAVAAPAADVVKLVVTRGAGERGYRPSAHAQPTRIVVGLPRPAWPATAWTDGIRLGWCRTRLGSNPALAGIKHLNRLEQVLARAEWDDARMDEGLMMDGQDHVICATQANLFARIDGRWVTPALGQCGVAGVMRRAFMDWCRQRGEPAVERELAAAELEAAGAILLTNALIGAWPVRELAGRRLPVDAQSAAFNAWVERQ